jgi:hypothetical protein
MSFSETSRASKDPDKTIKGTSKMRGPLSALAKGGARFWLRNPA